MTVILPSPMVPVDVDLRDFSFMPLEVVRLRDSGLTAKASGDEFRAAVLLWCAAWHQVPAASLPDDDDELASICGYSRAKREWSKVRAGAMRGWTRCDDGRLYHGAVAGKALEAWIEKLASAISGASGNAKRWGVEIDTETLREQFREAVAALRTIDPQSRTLRKKVVAVMAQRSPPDDAQRSPPDSPPESEPDSKGQGQGQGIEEKEETTHNGAPPTSGGRVCLALKRVGISDVQPGHPDLLALIAAGASDAEFESAGRSAVDRGKGFAYALGTLKRQRVEAARTAKAMHTGPLPQAPPKRSATDRQIATMNALTGKDRRHDRQPADAPETIDVTARVVP